MEHDSGGVEDGDRRLEYAGPETRRGTDALGTASMACGLLFLPGVIFLIALDGGKILGLMVFSLPFVAVVLGLIARRSEKRRGVVTWSTTRAYLVLAGVEVVVLLIIGIAIPQMGRSSETANRVKCGSNLRQIGAAVRLYANENGGRLPPDLETLVLTEDVIPFMLICPSSSDEMAKGPATRAVIQELRSGSHHCSYLYVGRGLDSRAATEAHVVPYEPVANHRGDGMNVLFGDGHVEFLNRREADYVLDELKGGHNPPRVVSTSGPSSRGG